MNHVIGLFIFLIVFTAGCIGVNQTPLEECNAIDDEHDKEHCILNLAIETNDVDLCNQISDQEEVEECLEGIQ